MFSGFSFKAYGAISFCTCLVFAANVRSLANERLDSPSHFTGESTQCSARKDVSLDNNKVRENSVRKGAKHSCTANAAHGKRQGQHLYSLAKHKESPTAPWEFCFGCLLPYGADVLVVFKKETCRMFAAFSTRLANEYLSTL